MCSVGVMVARGSGQAKVQVFSPELKDVNKEDRPLYLPLVVSSQPAKQQPQTALVGGALPCQLLPLPSPSGCVAV